MPATTVYTDASHFKRQLGSLRGNVLTQISLIIRTYGKPDADNVSLTTLSLVEPLVVADALILAVSVDNLTDELSVVADEGYNAGDQSIVMGDPLKLPVATLITVLTALQRHHYDAQQALPIPAPSGDCDRP